MLWGYIIKMNKKTNFRGILDGLNSLKYKLDEVCQESIEEKGNMFFFCWVNTNLLFYA